MALGRGNSDSEGLHLSRILGHLEAVTQGVRDFKSRIQDFTNLFQRLGLPGSGTYDVLNVEVHIAVRAHLSQLLCLLGIGTLDVLNIEVHIPVRVSLPREFFWLGTFISCLILSRSKLDFLIDVGYIIIKSNITSRHGIRLFVNCLHDVLLPIDSMCAQHDVFGAGIIFEPVLDS